MARLSVLVATFFFQQKPKSCSDFYALCVTPSLTHHRHHPVVFTYASLPCAAMGLLFVLCVSSSAMFYGFRLPAVR